MDIEDFKSRLISAGIDLRRVNLKGGLGEDQWGVDREGLSWVSYYSERGEVYSKQFHLKESEAWDRVLEQLLLQL